MSDGILYVSQKGFDDLVAELKKLKQFRRENAKRIDEARQHGDLSENAEYHAAKEAQLLNEIKLNGIQDKINRAQVMKDETLKTDEVVLGITVRLKDLGSGEEEKYMLVSEVEADYDQGKISTTSPIGKGLIGHKQGDVVEIQVPAGILKYEILEISN
jgi:transcription elongation factor GreA